MRIDDDGMLDGATFIPSPNCDERPQGCAIDLVVIHSISLPPGEFGGCGVIELFTNTLDASAHPYYQGISGLKVSSHFFVNREGRVFQFVPTVKRAWHAGVSTWRGRDNCNDRSIGIELEGLEGERFDNAQYCALARLLRALRRRYPIADVVGHEHVAPGRKADPGARFDWPRLARAVGARSERGMAPLRWE